MHKNVKDVTGQRFGRLLVLRHLGRSDRKRQSLWECLCDCGTVKAICSGDFNCERVVSCGCYRREQSRKAHLGVPAVNRLPEGEAAFNKLFANYRAAARRRGLEWALSCLECRELFGRPCRYCGVEPAQVAHSSSRGVLAHGVFLYNGLDRIDSRFGYLPWNVVPCCATCNRAKLAMPYEQWLVWLQRIATYWARG